MQGTGLEQARSGPLEEPRRAGGRPGRSLVGPAGADKDDRFDAAVLADATGTDGHRVADLTRRVEEALRQHPTATSS